MLLILIALLISPSSKYGMFSGFDSRFIDSGNDVSELNKIKRCFRLQKLLEILQNETYPIHVRAELARKFDIDEDGQIHPLRLNTLDW
jgi:hypothetical protein